MRSGSSSSVRVFYPRFSRQALLDRLREVSPALRAEIPVQRVVLFGSYARGRQTAASDIDLLVVYRGPARPDAFALVKRGLKIPGVEPHVYSETEYEQNKALVDRMIRDGVTVWEAGADGPVT